MHARPISLLAALCLALALAPASRGRSQDAPAAATAARTEAELRQLLDGQWNLHTSEATARQRIDAAIERSVSEMNFFLQGVTRTQLQEKTPLNRRIDLDFPEDGRITCVFDQRFTYTTRPRVSQQFTLPDGAVLDVTQHFQDGYLQQYFGHSLGRRWSTFTLSPDGRTLTITTTQQGPMMPVPVHFALDYRKPG